MTAEKEAAKEATMETFLTSTKFVCFTICLIIFPVAAVFIYDHITAGSGKIRKPSYNKYVFWRFFMYITAWSLYPTIFIEWCTFFKHEMIPWVSGYTMTPTYVFLIIVLMLVTILFVIINYTAPFFWFMKDNDGQSDWKDMYNEYTGEGKENQMKDWTEERKAVRDYMHKKRMRDLQHKNK